MYGVKYSIVKYSTVKYSAGVKTNAHTNLTYMENWWLSSSCVVLCTLKWTRYISLDNNRFNYNTKIFIIKSCTRLLNVTCRKEFETNMILQLNTMELNKNYWH